MRQKLFFLLLAVLLGSSTVFAQTVIKGIVIDKDTKEPLIGVSVFSEDSKVGIATDLDGSFRLRVPSLSGDVTISYIGYKSVNLPAMEDMGRIELETDAVGLNDVIITSSIGIDRKTPVAMSNIEAEVILLKLGSREFPEILKSTPGVYATKEGGGFGDSRVVLRGFESANTAVMVNGIPMNDMEWGGIYWSNWSGLKDVARIIQVQRGLGASKLSAPAVGGSINIVTKSVDAEKGGSVFYGMGNNGFNKISFNVSSGLMENGWAITLMGGKEWADGYVQATDYEGYNYFLNVSKMIGDNHQLSLTAFGSPQWHNQRKDPLLISEWAKLPEDSRYQYNAGYGYDASGQFKTFNRNSYHKPQISLNHIWDINLKSSLSTSAYLSLGSGGGYSGVGNNRTAYYGSTAGVVNKTYRKNDGLVAGFGTLDFERFVTENTESLNGSQLAIQNAINNHVWFGLLSTYSSQITDEIQIQGGIDFRYYKGIHKTKIVDLLGGAFLIDPQRSIDGKFKNDTDWVNEKLTVGDIVYRDYDGFVMQEGVFGQAEYVKNSLSAFVAGSFNVTNYWRMERYTADNEKSDTKNKVGFGIKGGANYNLNDYHNVFANVGYFSRTPFYSKGIFLQNQRSNAMNDEGKNEKVFSAELGYGFRSRHFTANVNLYRTEWNDKTTVIQMSSNSPESNTVNLGGVNALHMGLEIEFTARPVKNLEIKGMASFGNWKWQKNASGYAYDVNGNAIDIYGNVVDPGSTDHAFVEVRLDGIHVGNSAQTTLALGVDYEFFKGFRLGFDYNYFGRNFAKYSTDVTKVGVTTFKQPWRIPDANLFDLNANYKFEIGTFKATIFGNIDNLFDAIYITDATDGGSGTWESAQVYYGFGRTWRIGMRVNF